MEKIEIIVGLLSGILPEIIAGIIGFLLARYTYHKNVPLDKLEITYNRVYYPLRCLINNNKERIDVIKKSEFYIKKYDKYLDRSTRKLFKDLKENPEDGEIYDNFIINISDFNRKLRRRLGYLEPRDLSLYKYLTTSERRGVRIVPELIGVYIGVIAYIEISLSVVQVIAYIILIISVIALIYELICFCIECFMKRIMKKKKAEIKCLR